MSFSPQAGYAGRVRSFRATPVLAAGQPTLTGLTPVTIAEITKWSVKHSLKSGANPIVTYESAGNASGTLYGDVLQGGVGSWTVDVQGFYSIDGTDSRFAIGFFVVMDLIPNKSAAFGYNDVSGKVTSYNTDFDVNSDAVTFSATIQGTGQFPAYAALT
jgi:hypothetical protein